MPITAIIGMAFEGEKWPGSKLGQIEYQSNQGDSMAEGQAAAATFASLPLALATQSLDNISVPFEGDQLGRDSLAQRLTGYVERLACGAVLAIDAPWGEGKTWFTRHWAAQLQQAGWRIGLIDAFAQDYVGDPFLLLAAEIRQLTAKDPALAKRLSDSAAAVARAILPGALKLTLNAGGRWLLGTNGLGEDALAWAKGFWSHAPEDLATRGEEALKRAVEKSGDLTEAWARQKLEAHEQEKKSVAGFHRVLREFAAQSDQPVVIFIDELDRCRPEFAVRLVERIKHFFDVPNLVFVLVMNREQLESAIEGVYGAKTNAAEYLGKFLHLSLRLPKERTANIDPRSAAVRFIEATLQRYRVVGNVGHLTETVACAVQLFDLSMRDVERIFALRFLSDLPWHGLLVCLSALKLKKPEIFRGLTVGHQPGVLRLVDYLEQCRQTGRWASGSVGQYLSVLIAFARIAGGQGDAAASNLVKENGLLIFDADAQGWEPAGALISAARSLELDLQ